MGQRYVYACAECVRTRRDAFASFTAFAATIVGVAVLADALLNLRHPGHILPPGLQGAEWWAFFWLWAYASIIPHEMAHAAVGRALGFRIWQICLGRGRCLFRTRVRGVTFEWHAIPVVGHVLASTDRAKAYRLRRFVLLAAGPLANLLLLIAAMKLASSRSAAASSDSDSLLILYYTMGIANAMLLLGSLFGRRPIQTANGTARCDGRQMVELLRTKTLSSETVLRQHNMTALTLHCRNSEFERALAVAEQMGLGESKDAGTLLMHASAAFAIGNYSQVRTIVLNALALAPEPSEIRAMVCNFMAWNDLMFESSELLEEAEHYAREAFGLLPWQAAVQSTLGHILVERGEIAAGTRLLYRALKGANDNSSRAATLCSLVISYARSNKFVEANKLLLKARRLDPRCEMLKKAEASLRST